MSTTTMPAAIDALVALANGLTIAPAPPDGTAAVVSDGYPGTQNAPDMLTIGGMIEATEDADQAPADLGADFEVEEEYEVRCYVASSRGGTDQKPARDAAFAIFSAFQAALRADSTLARTVRVAYVTRVTVKQTDVQDGGDGRRCLIAFSVKCAARI